jgi:hypothetical protein
MQKSGVRAASKIMTTCEQWEKFTYCMAWPMASACEPCGSFFLERCVQQELYYRGNERMNNTGNPDYVRKSLIHPFQELATCCREEAASLTFC